MRYLVMVMVFVVTGCLTAGCRGSSVDLDPQPQLEYFQAYQGSGTTIRIHAAANTADPGTTARVILGAIGQGTVDATGGFSFDAELASAASSTSAATDIVTLDFMRQGSAVQSTQTVVSMYESTMKPYFPTESAPNDMVYKGDVPVEDRSLYIANSMSNSVVRYSTIGHEQARATFPEYASPSYLTLAGETLWVITNGDNKATALNATTMEVLYTADIANPATGDIAFIGPGIPAWTGAELNIPAALIVSFGDTTGYAEAAVLYYDPLDGSSETSQRHVLSGRNGQCSLYDAVNERLLVTSAGEIQFNENWEPAAESDSYLDIFGPGESHTAVNLGPVGAAGIAISPGGQYAYLGNNLTGNVYKVDLEAGEVLRGIDNPIILTTEFTYISDLDFTPGGEYLLATSFNTDELYVIDPATDTINPGCYPEPFDLSLDTDLMAGCIDVEVGKLVEGGCWVFVLYGIANSVAVVQVRW